MKRVSVRVGIALLTLFVFAVPFVIAGGAAEDDPDEVTLRIGEHPGPHIQAMEEYFIPRYEEETGINIEMEVLPPDQVWQRFMLDAPEGDWDIGYHSPGWFGYFYEHVADLTPHTQQYDHLAQRARSGAGSLHPNVVRYHALGVGSAEEHSRVLGSEHTLSPIRRTRDADVPVFPRDRDIRNLGRRHHGAPRDADAANRLAHAWVLLRHTDRG